MRVIAATNQDLGRLVQERKFRADLFYRLNVFPIALPPLRERLDDIPLLAEHFVEAFARQQGKTIDFIPEDVMLALGRYDWPGNIRELQNVIERGVVRTTGRVLSRHTTRVLRLPTLNRVAAPSSPLPPRDPLASGRWSMPSARISLLFCAKPTGWLEDRAEPLLNSGSRGRR